MKNKHIEASNEKDTKSTTETKKRRKFKLISPISASVVAVILCGAILFNHIIYPKIGPDVESTTTSGKDPNIESTTTSGKDQSIESTTASKDDPSVPDINPLNDYIVSAPSYPVMAKYTSDYNSDEYDAWREGIYAQRSYYYYGGKNLVVASPKIALALFLKKSTRFFPP